MQLIITPCVPGDGKRLFGSGVAPTGMKAVETRVAENGVIIARYEPGAEIPNGQMGF